MSSRPHPRGKKTKAMKKQKDLSECIILLNIEEQFEKIELCAINRENILESKIAVIRRIS